MGKGNLFGTLNVLEASGEGSPRVEVDVYTFTYDTNGADSVRIDLFTNEVILNYDRDGMIPVRVHTRLYLRVGSLRELTLSTNCLDINLDIPGAYLSKTTINSADGALRFEKGFRSQKTEAHVVAGVISGKLSLYDRLGLSTESGSIKIEVTPEEVAGKAVTDIRTTSGQVEVDFTGLVGSRSYDTTLESKSGGLSGKLPAGDVLLVKSNSGDINIGVFSTASKTSLFGTENVSGGTVVRVEGQGRGQLLSHHTSVSGDIDVGYPSAWEGEIHVKAAGGEVRLDGNGIQLVQELTGSGKKEIWADKGNVSKARLMAQSKSGDVRILLGA
ncbi:hypothetical protein ABW19_dt0205164 [Dactylella cylindrospora]|nr:hypothetical protein ABW19_dt0205164 [Dactylella cylindrospora]